MTDEKPENPKVTGEISSVTLGFLGLHSDFQVKLADDFAAYYWVFGLYSDFQAKLTDVAYYRYLKKLPSVGAEGNQRKSGV